MTAPTTKFARLTLSVMAAGLVALNALAGGPESGTINIRYAEVSEIYAIVKLQLGAEAVSAITAVDNRTNSLILNNDHAVAKKVRKFVASLDQPKPTIKVAAVIKQVIPATSTAAASEKVLASPTIMGHPGRPLKLDIPAVKEGTVQLELTVVPVEP